ncbi:MULTISPECIES: ATP-binding protein [Actinomycetaceae]|uniref:ATP-binding protein n=2 Tax=Actinomycetaceae TaxID=2049 RepID=A0ABV3N8N6_9ACTO|nr:ATP-binding protein [Actinomyces bovis]SPT53184.1 Divergent AAA domain [Actinomyces bovis]VEG52397.1 Divergent AAA domain [Actinomyces israelii]
MSSKDVNTALGKPAAQAVAALLSLDEDQWFERKSGRAAVKDLARPMVAFANAEGGTLAIGLSNGQIDGVSQQAENEIRQAPIDFTVPPVRAQVTRLDVDDKAVLIVHVDPGDTIHTTKSGDCYLRIGDESRRLSLAEQQELAYDRGSQTFEATPADLTVNDLDETLMNSYRVAIGSSSNVEMLHARDLLNRRGQVTAAATLLFDTRPQRDFPSAYIRVLKYDDDERGVGSEMTLLDDVRIEGPLPQQIVEAAAAVERLTPAPQQLTESGRFERVPIIPRDAWLEGVVNAVVHRSYSMMGDHIRVEIFPHRIEITSPGRFPGFADTSSPLTISRYARNPRIARVCADMGITRELGEGIKRIFHEMHRRGLANPIYRQSASSVTLTLKASDAVAPAVLDGLTKSARVVLDVLRLQNRPLGTGQVAELAGIARPTAKRALESLLEADLVRWDGKSDHDPRASWRLL